MPVSRTVSTSCSSTTSSTATDPARVYLMALLTRLRTTFSHRRTSRSTGAEPRPATVICSPARSPASTSGSTRRRVNSCTSIGSAWAWRRPLSDREISRRSSTIPSSRWHCAYSCSTAGRSRASTRPDKTSCSGPSSKVSGVRSSWLIVERKCVLAVLSSARASTRAASSSRARAASRRCSTHWDSCARKLRCASSSGRRAGSTTSRTPSPAWSAVAASPSGSHALRASPARRTPGAPWSTTGPGSPNWAASTEPLSRVNQIRPPGSSLVWRSSAAAMSRAASSVPAALTVPTSRSSSSRRAPTTSGVVMESTARTPPGWSPSGTGE